MKHGSDSNQVSDYIANLLSFKSWFPRTKFENLKCAVETKITQAKLERHEESVTSVTFSYAHPGANTILIK